MHEGKVGRGAEKRGRGIGECTLYDRREQGIVSEGLALKWRVEKHKEK